MGLFPHLGHLSKRDRALEGLPQLKIALTSLGSELLPASQDCEDNSSQGHPPRNTPGIWNGEGAGEEGFCQCASVVALKRVGTGLRDFRVPPFQAQLGLRPLSLQ